MIRPNKNEMFVSLVSFFTVFFFGGLDWNLWTEENLGLFTIAGWFHNMRKAFQITEIRSDALNHQQKMVIEFIFFIFNKQIILNLALTYTHASCVHI